MKKILVFFSIILFGLLLSACGSRAHESPLFEEKSYKSYASVRESECSCYALPSTVGFEKIPIWKVADVDGRFEYDIDNDHVDIVDMIAYDKYGNEYYIDRDSVWEIFIEWTPKGNYIYLDYIIFTDSTDNIGFYIYSLGDTIPMK